MRISTELQYTTATGQDSSGNAKLNVSFSVYFQDKTLAHRS